MNNLWILIGFTFAVIGMWLTIRSFKHRKHYNEQIAAAKEEYDFLANHDSLTKLPNRAFFERELTKAIKSTKGQIWVYYLDADSLKRVNDSFSHSAGDSILVEVAYRLGKIIDNKATVARYGSDDFVLFASDLKHADEAEAFARKILQVLQEPFQVLNQVLNLGFSIGVSGYPADGEDAGSLVRTANIAMREAKKLGSNRIEFYDKSMAFGVARHLYLETCLPKALAEGEIFLNYQPQINAESGEVYGVEALARWKHPYLGMVSPLEFIAAAEKSGFIVELGEWILKEALRQAKQWEQEGLPPFQLSVNVSPRQIGDPNFVKLVKQTLAETGIPPQRLELEITENLIMDNFEVAAEVFEKLTDIGVKFAIDDFGTGYSSLAFLHRLPLHTMKLDKTFVQAIGTNTDNVIIETMIDLARNLQLGIVAEGVETKRQVDFLLNGGCTMMQGYLFSKPMKPVDLRKFILSGNSGQIDMHETAADL